MSSGILNTIISALLGGAIGFFSSQCSADLQKEKEYIYKLRVKLYELISYHGNSDTNTEYEKLTDLYSPIMALLASLKMYDEADKMQNIFIDYYVNNFGLMTGSGVRGKMQDLSKEIIAQLDFQKSKQNSATAEIS